MTGHTKERLLAAAAALLDRGGQGAVTLRAVAEAVGVSHNAPYRHFTDRNALMAAVAEQDFRTLSDGFREAAASAGAEPPLRTAGLVLIAYARAHPARYRLLFSDPDIASGGGTLGPAAFDAFVAFSAIVRHGQARGRLPALDTIQLTGLIYATLHGAIDLELGGRAMDRKGLGSIEATFDILLALLQRTDAPGVVR